MTSSNGNEIVPAPHHNTQNVSPAAAQPRVLLVLGALQITDTHVFTPAGPIPLASSHVSFVDQSRTFSKTPSWAIVLAIVTAWFFLLGLLFLLAKDHRTEGYVSITVQGRDGRGYTEHVRVGSQLHRDQVVAQAQWLQQLAASSNWRASQG